MSTVLSVLKSAYRRANILGMASTVEGTELDSILSSVGVERIRGFYRKLATNGGLGRLEDYYADADYEAEEMQQIHNSGGDTITLPTTIIDDSTGLTRKPRHGAVVVIIDGSTAPYETEVHIFDAHYGWVDTTELGLEDYAPLTGTHDEHIKNLLAEYLAAEDGTPPSQILLRDAANARMALTAMYGNTRKPGKYTYF